MFHRQMWKKWKREEARNCGKEPEGIVSERCFSRSLSVFTFFVFLSDSQYFLLLLKYSEQSVHFFHVSRLQLFLYQFCHTYHLILWWSLPELTQSVTQCTSSERLPDWIRPLGVESWNNSSCHLRGWRWAYPQHWRSHFFFTPMLLVWIWTKSS